MNFEEDADEMDGDGSGEDEDDFDMDDEEEEEEEEEDSDSDEEGPVHKLPSKLQVCLSHKKKKTDIVIHVNFTPKYEKVYHYYPMEMMLMCRCGK